MLCTRTDAKVSVDDTVTPDAEIPFECVFEHAAIGMALVAPNGRWLRANRALCRIVGYSQDELRRTDFQSLTHPDDLPADLVQVRRMLAGEIESYGLEKRYFARSGDVVWIQLNVSLVRDTLSRPHYFIAQIQDITPRKRDEQALRETETLFRRLTTHAPVGLFQSDVHGNYTFVSDRWCTIAGLDRTAAVGQGWQQALNAEDREQVVEGWRLAIWQQTEFSAECRFVTPTGAVHWVALSSRPLCDAAGDLLGHIGTVLDMTAQKQAELELHERMEEYQLAFDSDALARAQLDLSTACFLRVNQKLCELTGYTREELLERSFLDLTHPDDREAEMESLLDMISGRAVHYTAEKRYVRKDGSILWIQLEANVVAADETGPRRTIATIQDVTARKQFDQDQAAVNARLRQLAETDELTGLPNRRYLTDKLQELWREEARRPELGCLLIDLDGFKRANDLGCGHATGDAALRSVATVLRSALRPTDYCCRYGGDEFVVLALSAPRSTLGEIGERIRRAIETCHVPELHGMLRLTASIGVACGADCPSGEALLAEADRLLYQAKHNGRNRVEGPAATSLPLGLIALESMPEKSASLASQ